MSHTVRTGARPPQIGRRPRRVPLSPWRGATPTTAAICCRVSVPNSEWTGPTGRRRLIADRPSQCDRGQTERAPLAYRTLREIGRPLLGEVIVAEEPELLVGRGERTGDVGGMPASRQVFTSSPWSSPTSATPSPGQPRTALACHAIGLSQAWSPRALVTSLAIRSLGFLSTAVCTVPQPSVPRPFPRCMARLAGAVSECWGAPLASHCACKPV